MYKNDLPLTITHPPNYLLRDSKSTGSWKLNTRPLDLSLLLNHIESYSYHVNQIKAVTNLSVI